jgi:peroxiredoxin
VGWAPGVRSSTSIRSFAADGHERLYKRLTLVVDGGRIEHVFYPVFPPDRHARQVLGWLREHPVRGR